MKLSEFDKNNNQIKTLLEEINDFRSTDDKNVIIENRANHVIQSAIHLLERIEEQYDPEIADLMQRRLLNSIKGKDPKKFTRMMNKLRDE